MTTVQRRRLLGSAPLDPVVRAWLNRLTSSPSSAYIKALDTMIKGMRADGNLLLLDRFWIFATEVQSHAQRSIVNPTNTLTEVNGPTWTAKIGYTGNAVTQYLNSNFIPSSNGVNYTTAIASIGVYIRTEKNVKTKGIKK